MAEEQQKPAEQNLSDMARTSYDEGRRKAQEMERVVETYIREKPVQSLLIAAGAGLVLGLLWARR
jgi:ElaB/YqjD/DUF883 family membrane-anchored ribosome-binding protein